MSKCNIFTVFKPSQYQKEELVWKISSSNEDQLLFTNQRIADLPQGKFMNFDGQNLKDAQINCYQHYRNDEEERILAGKKGQAGLSSFGLGEEKTWNLAKARVPALVGAASIVHSIVIAGAVGCVGRLEAVRWRIRTMLIIHKIEVGFKKCFRTGSSSMRSKPVVSLATNWLKAGNKPLCIRKIVEVGFKNGFGTDFCLPYRYKPGWKLANQ